jgi:predicted DNA-binding protein (MmcQ/YjbR family)
MKPARPRRASGALAAAETALRAHAMAKPEATEHFPWGERAIKVKGKVFLFMYADATQLSLSTKLPQSVGVALLLPFAKPTGYGLGKAGWVSARFEPADAPPVDMLCDWIDESYQAVAPAKLAAAARAVPSATAEPPPARRPAAKRATPARRTAAKRATPARPAAKRATPARPAAKRATPARRTAAKRATPARPAARRATPARPAARRATPARPAARRRAARRA